MSIERLQRDRAGAMIGWAARPARPHGGMRPVTDTALPYTGSDGEGRAYFEDECRNGLRGHVMGPNGPISHVHRNGTIWD